MRTLNYDLEGTSALGSFRSSAPPVCSFIISGALAAPGTFAGLPCETPNCDEGTRTGVAAVHSNAEKIQAQYSEATRQAIMELRRVTGLTWDHIANIFQVSRRSVHNWANGKTMTQSNEEKLHEILSVARRIDTGSAASNRSAFLSKDSSGRSPLEMLTDSKYSDAIKTIGVSDTRRKSPAHLSDEEFNRRKAPSSPEQLLDALHEKVHVDLEPPRRVSKTRIRKR